MYNFQNSVPLHSLQKLAPFVCKPPVKLTGLQFATADPFNYNNCSQPLYKQHIRSYCWSVKHWLALPAFTTSPVSQIVSYLPV